MSLKDAVEKIKKRTSDLKSDAQGTRLGVQETLKTARPEILSQRPTFILREPLLKRVRRLRGRA